MMKPHEANQAFWDASTRRFSKTSLEKTCAFWAAATTKWLSRCIVKVDEHEKKIEDEFWMTVKLDKLPASLLIVGRKDHEAGLNR